MSLVKLNRVALIAVQAVTLGYMSGTLIYPLSCLLLALASLNPAIAFPLSQRNRIGILAALGFGFLIKWWLFPLDTGSRTALLPTDYTAMHALAQYLLLVQALDPFPRPSPHADRVEAETHSLPFLGIVVMIAACNYVATTPQHRICLLLAALFAGLYTTHLLLTAPQASHPSRSRTRTILQVLILVAGLGLGTAFSGALYANLSTVDTLFVRLLSSLRQDERVGFSDQAKLDSVRFAKDTKSQRTMLRVESDTQPGYFRALTYETYTRKEWRRSKASERLNPSPPLQGIPAPMRSNENVFLLRESPNPPPQVMASWAHAALREVVPLPLHTRWVAATANSALLNPAGILSIPGRPATTPYRLGIGPTPRDETLAPPLREAYLSLPEDLDPRLATLAESLFKDCPDDASRVRAATAYFRDHYEYHLGIDIPEGQDPLTWFLLKQPPAHCEYFASGTAILLRLGGVPARYVTGFVVAEHNPFGGYWVARNRDAHAWAEAWVDGQGWITVEATPAAGVPSGQASSQWALFWDSLRFRAAKLFAGLREKGVAAVPACLAPLFRIIVGTWPGRFALLAAALLVLLRRIHRRQPRSRDMLPPELLALRRFLRTMDRRLKKKGWVRRPNETLHQFAARITAADDTDAWLREAAAWYLEYAHIRYSAPSQPDPITRLRLPNR